MIVSIRRNRFASEKHSSVDHIVTTKFVLFQNTCLYQWKTEVFYLTKSKAMNEDTRCSELEEEEKKGQRVGIGGEIFIGQEQSTRIYLIVNLTNCKATLIFR